MEINGSNYVWKKMQNFLNFAVDFSNYSEGNVVKHF